MLEINYQKQLDLLLEKTECGIVIPESWENFFVCDEIIRPEQNDERRFFRRCYRQKAILEIEQSLPKIVRGRQYSCILTKDFSRNGIGFFHTEQLFPGEHAILWLVTRKIVCTVSRCHYHNSSCYEIGARFADNQITKELLNE